jgi:hypothetical protein
MRSPTLHPSGSRRGALFLCPGNLSLDAKVAGKVAGGSGCGAVVPAECAADRGFCVEGIRRIELRSSVWKT